MCCTLKSEKGLSASEFYLCYSIAQQTTGHNFYSDGIYNNPTLLETIFSMLFNGVLSLNVILFSPMSAPVSSDIPGSRIKERFKPHVTT